MVKVNGEAEARRMAGSPMDDQKDDEFASGAWRRKAKAEREPVQHDGGEMIFDIEADLIIDPDAEQEAN
jgi:hypothetical protein